MKLLQYFSGAATSYVWYTSTKRSQHFARLEKIQLQRSISSIITNKSWKYELNSFSGLGGDKQWYLHCVESKSALWNAPVGAETQKGVKVDFYGKAVDKSGL